MSFHMSANQSSYELQGWTPSPDGRGTLDIVWASMATIFLCTWSAICLNVPEPTDTMWSQLRRKTFISGIAILGPEFLLGYAIEEWQAARASVTAFKTIRGDEKWTRKHAFFANMGGFALRTKDGTTFFLDAAHIIWLKRHRVFSDDQFERHFLLDHETIEDRNKADLFLRLFSVAQALWFSINIIARAVQHLAVTTLEITVVGMIVNSVLIYYFWRDKPADVQRFDIVEIDLTLDELLLKEQDQVARARPWFRTPLDFTSREVWWISLIYAYLINILKRVLCWPWRWSSESRHRRDLTKPALGRRSDNDVLPLKVLGLWLTLSLTGVHLGINFIAWNFHFATWTEQFLWRLSSSIMVFMVVSGVIIAQIFLQPSHIKKMQESIQQRRTILALGPRSVGTGGPKWTGLAHYRLRCLVMAICNNSPNQDPNLDMPLWFVLVYVPGFAVYVLARMYFLVEDFVALRALPVGAYRTVEWSKFIPHVG